MKKYLALLLVLCLSLAMVACESNDEQSAELSVSNETSEEDLMKAEFDKANEAYLTLQTASTHCSKVAEAINQAWNFSIYDFDKYIGKYSEGVAEFCRRTGISRSKLDQVSRKLTNLSSADGFLFYSSLGDFSTAVSLIIEAYESTFSSIEERLELAKQSLKTLSSEYADYTGYEMLREYYSEISNFYDFCQDPRCSLNEFSSTVNSYERNLNACKNDLEFIFD